MHSCYKPNPCIIITMCTALTEACSLYSLCTALTSTTYSVNPSVLRASTTCSGEMTFLACFSEMSLASLAIRWMNSTWEKSVYRWINSTEKSAYIGDQRYTRRAYIYMVINSTREECIYTCRGSTLHEKSAYIHVGDQLYTRKVHI